jgi:hypothetical protein
MANAAAAMLIWALHSFNGTDKLGMPYLQHMRHITTNLGLYDKRFASQVYDSSRPKRTRARAIFSLGYAPLGSVSAKVKVRKTQITDTTTPARPNSLFEPVSALTTCRRFHLRMSLMIHTKIYGCRGREREGQFERSKMKSSSLKRVSAPLSNISFLFSENTPRVPSRYLISQLRLLFMRN